MRRAQEEAVVLPSLPADDPLCQGAIRRTPRDHARIREAVDALSVSDVEAAHTLGTLLHDHVRFEERVLFPLVEERLSPAALAEIGIAVGDGGGDGGGEAR
jgi:hypothetical protein